MTISTISDHFKVNARLINAWQPILISLNLAGVLDCRLTNQVKSCRSEELPQHVASWLKFYSISTVQLLLFGLRPEYFPNIFSVSKPNNQQRIRQNDTNFHLSANLLRVLQSAIFSKFFEWVENESWDAIRSLMSWMKLFLFTLGYFSAERNSSL